MSKSLKSQKRRKRTGLGTGERAAKPGHEDPEVLAARRDPSAIAFSIEAAAAAAAAAEALEREKQELEDKKQASLKQKKNTLKKIKEIDAIEAKMQEKGQTFDELLPEVKGK
ncbi:unnamed protein product, partial [Effrenium voratum]